jgi:exodeoxyribonuclease-3
MQINLVTWNVNGIRACYKNETGLKEFLKDFRPDILCLQETKAHRDQVEPEAQTLGYKTSLWSSAVRKGYSGVATFFNDQIHFEAKGWGQSEYDSEGRIVWTRHEHFDLYNIYFPNGGSGEERHNFKQKFLQDLNVHLKAEIKKGRKIVLVGDYNVAHKEIDVHDPVRLSKESGFLPEERAWFSSFLELGFVDCFRHFHEGEKDRYSWWSYREMARVHNRGWRIDYICVSENLRQNLKSADILDQVTGSDHCPVVATLQF